MPADECCVCFESTTSRTPCEHTLCDGCRQHLVIQICPLCRGFLLSEEDDQYWTTTSESDDDEEAPVYDDFILDCDAYPVLELAAYLDWEPSGRPVGPAPDDDEQWAHCRALLGPGASD